MHTATSHESIGNRTHFDEADIAALILDDVFPLGHGYQDQSHSVLWQRYADSEEGGSYQATQPLRFSAEYGYDPDLMRRDFGRDVDPLGHMDDVHNILTKLLLVELQTRHSLGSIAISDIPFCRFTAQTHDVGENTHTQYGGGVGDIPFGKKTPEKREIEQDVRMQIAIRYWPDLPVELLTRVDSLIMHTPQTAEAMAAYEAVEGAHRLGVYTTGILGGRAGVAILRDLEARGQDRNALPETEQLRLTQLIRLSQDVTTSMQPLVEEVSSRFIYGEMLLKLFEPDLLVIRKDLTA